MKHIIESQQITRRFIDKLFLLADNIEKKPHRSLRGKIMASLFYEPSTRTRFSFESAMLRLGGNVITSENAKEFSSAAKGETLEDSIRVINNYADIIVLRHYEQGASKRASLVSDIPVINAGDGIGQHPTQALLDLYTIKRELGRIDKISIALIGDLKHGRTVRSLVYLLGKFKSVKIHFVSPAGLRIGEDIRSYLRRYKIFYSETRDLESILTKVDVVYQTRIQKERFKTAKEYLKFKDCYHIDIDLIEKMRPGSIIMHPLPRVGEISPSVDISPKAVYFKQAKYGVLVRMALLKYMLDR